MRINGGRDFIMAAIVAALMITFTAPAVMASDTIMPGKPTSTTRSELEELAIRMSWLMDKAKGEGLSALFTKDGIWEQPRGTYKGRAEIDGFFAPMRKSGDGIARRVVTNFMLLEEKGDWARGEAIMLAFAGAGPGPYPTNITLVLDCGYDFKRDTDGVWRVQKLVMKVAFGTVPQVSAPAR